jgi:hypothetical protein
MPVGITFKAPSMTPAASILSLPRQELIGCDSKLLRNPNGTNYLIYVKTCQIDTVLPVLKLGPDNQVLTHLQAHQVRPHLRQIPV